MSRREEKRKREEAELLKRRAENPDAPLGPGAPKGSMARKRDGAYISPAVKAADYETMQLVQKMMSGTDREQEAAIEKLGGKDKADKTAREIMKRYGYQIPEGSLTKRAAKSAAKGIAGAIIRRLT